MLCNSPLLSRDQPYPNAIYAGQPSHQASPSVHKKRFMCSALGARAFIPEPFEGAVPQVGYIQIGSEQMLIQPVNTSETSFSGKEHFIRRRRSTKSSHPMKSHIPDEHCKVVAGFSVPVYSVAFIALLPHYPTDIPAFYWMDSILNGGSGSRGMVLPVLGRTEIPSLRRGIKGKETGETLGNYMGSQVEREGG
ncbi:hypothetical protein llap_15985 [Limosa lapponica baueri]|uniref:Uncharacterized protein n=1 Tax=Limosa lapponica baueri TaxID=1758121 RepID=A0A2I0TIT4_LIMLA|nr:hypothetical protein llap_15985 [Limosa lapponica baueri]